MARTRITLRASQKVCVIYAGDFQATALVPPPTSLWGYALSELYKEGLRLRQRWFHKWLADWLLGYRLPWSALLEQFQLEPIFNPNFHMLMGRGAQECSLWTWLGTNWWRTLICLEETCWEDWGLGIRRTAWAHSLPSFWIHLDYEMYCNLCSWPYTANRWQCSPWLQTKHFLAVLDRRGVDLATGLNCQ